MLQRISGHVNILGNERADTLAKRGASYPQPDVCLRTHVPLNSHLGESESQMTAQLHCAHDPMRRWEHHLFECPTLPDLSAQYSSLNPSIENSIYIYTLRFCHVMESKGESPSTVESIMNE